MYIIYLLDIKDIISPIKILHFADSEEQVVISMEEKAKEFIIDYEGKLKLDSVFIEETTSFDNLKDGYYFVKHPNKIVVYKKTSKTETKKYWLSDGQVTTHNKEFVHEYRFCQFTADVILDKPIVSVKKTSDKILPNPRTRNTIDGLIHEMKHKGFRQVLRHTCSETSDEHKKEKLD